MDARIFIDFLNTVERLKCHLRNSWTSSGCRESVAEHSWRLALMAVMCSDEYPGLDMNKVIKKECRDFPGLFEKMDAMTAKETRLVRALDKMEVLE